MPRKNDYVNYGNQGICTRWYRCRVACKSIGKPGNESIAGITGEGNEVMKNSEILVEKFDVQNFQQVKI